ncbi:MAG TPA: hypothetical protein VLJ39_00615 [Tepidisphaeraceae bacterium]|nr:hypothetical protein [Tepidisphaeraceae bacterium]
MDTDGHEEEKTTGICLLLRVASCPSWIISPIPMSINLENREPPSAPRTPRREMRFVCLAVLASLAAQLFLKPEDSRAPFSQKMVRHGARVDLPA